MAYGTFGAYYTTYLGYPSLLCQILSGYAPWWETLVACASGGVGGYTPGMILWDPGGGMAIPFMQMATSGGVAYYENYYGVGSPEPPYTPSANTLLLFPARNSLHDLEYSAWAEIYSADGDWWYAYPPY